MAEHVPFWEFAPVREFFQKQVGLGSIWELGKEDTIFAVNDSEGKEVRFGAPICFEDAFPYLCRRFVLKGADLLVNLTNDAWSRTNSAQVQHFVVARFRSIEMKRVLVRSTNGGLTAIVGPFGEIRQSLPMFQTARLAVEIPVFKEDGLTPYTRYGDWFPRLLGIILLAALVRSLRRAGPGLDV
jgi:apolipoprotein N-acyltransferase